MAVMRLQMTIDSTVYPDLHDLLLPLAGAGRAEKLRYLATVGLLLQRQSAAPASLLQPLVTPNISGLPATAVRGVAAGSPQGATAIEPGVAVMPAAPDEDATAAVVALPAADASAIAGSPPKAPSRASSLARRMSSDLLGGRSGI